MKKTALFIVISILIMSCNKDNTGNRQVVIKGKIPFAGSVKGQMVKAGGSLSLNDAKKILVFDGLDLEGTLLSTSFVDIIDGSFSAGAKLGNAAALVFLDADNKYIGTLSTRGLMLLPLGNLSDGENTTIDLSSLTLSGTSVLPSYDPFGKEIIISDSELKILKEMDGFFESLAKNIDADNDGIPDILNDKQVYIRTQYEVSAGRYGVNTTPSSISTTALNKYKLYIFCFRRQGIYTEKYFSFGTAWRSSYRYSAAVFYYRASWMRFRKRFLETEFFRGSKQSVAIQFRYIFNNPR